VRVLLLLLCAKPRHELKLPPGQQVLGELIAMCNKKKIWTAIDGVEQDGCFYMLFLALCWAGLPKLTRWEFYRCCLGCIYSKHQVYFDALVKNQHSARREYEVEALRKYT
jgi:hypothetical protein